MDFTKIILIILFLSRFFDKILVCRWPCNSWPVTCRDGNTESKFYLPAE